MCDVGFLSSDPLEEFEAFCQREMGMMVADFDAVDGYGVEALELFEFLVLDEVHIGQIRDVAEPVSKDRNLLLLQMPALDWGDFH